MGLRIDVEMQHVAFLAPSRAGGEFAAVSHLDGDGVIAGVQVGLHRRCPEFLMAGDRRMADFRWNFAFLYRTWREATSARLQTCSRCCLALPAPQGQGIVAA